jgi:hypothetical protein
VHMNGWLWGVFAPSLHHSFNMSLSTACRFKSLE